MDNGRLPERKTELAHREPFFFAETGRPIDLRWCQHGWLGVVHTRALLAEVQSLLVSQQTAGWMESQLACHRCGSMLARKDARSIVLRTVFGKVDVPSPRLWACNCAAKQGQPRRSVSPLCKVVHQRVTPELEYLQAKWAAHLPYRQATELLRVSNEVKSSEKCY